jgi:AraC-like DNA-binding protein
LGSNFKPEMLNPASFLQALWDLLSARSESPEVDALEAARFFLFLDLGERGLLLEASPSAKDFFHALSGVAASLAYPMRLEFATAAQTRGRVSEAHELIAIQIPWERLPGRKLFAIYALGILINALLTLGIKSDELNSHVDPELQLELAQSAWARPLRRAQWDLYQVLASRFLAQKYPQSIRSDFSEKAFSLLRLRSADTHFGAKELSRELGVSLRTLERRLQQEKLSLRDFKQKLRIQAAMELLQLGLKSKEVAKQVGFSDHSSFTRAFRRWTGVPPSKYKKTSK